MNFFLAVCLTLVRSFAILLLLLFLASNPKTARAGRGETVIAGNGVVATDETECSKIGRDMLRRGGHAVDAAVAAALCLGVTSPSYSGLGGGGFMLVRSSRGDAKVFDMREMAPGRAFKVHLLVNIFTFPLCSTFFYNTMVCNHEFLDITNLSMDQLGFSSSLIHRNYEDFSMKYCFGLHLSAFIVYAIFTFA